MQKLVHLNASLWKESQNSGSQHLGKRLIELLSPHPKVLSSCHEILSKDEAHLTSSSFAILLKVETQFNLLS